MGLAVIAMIPTTMLWAIDRPSQSDAMGCITKKCLTAYRMQSRDTSLEVSAIEKHLGAN